MDPLLPTDAAHDAAHHAALSAARSALRGEAGGWPGADQLIDRLLPSGFEWRRAILEWPIVSVLTVAAVGFLLGRQRGGSILAGFRSGASDAASEHLSGVDLGNREPDGPA